MVWRGLINLCVQQLGAMLVKFQMKIIRESQGRSGDVKGRGTAYQNGLFSKNEPSASAENVKVKRSYQCIRTTWNNGCNFLKTLFYIPFFAIWFGSTVK